MFEQEISRKINEFRELGLPSYIPRQQVDFLCINERGKPDLAIQVCMDIQDPKTLERELAPLLATAQYFGIKNCRLLTFNQYAEFKEQGIHIRALPVWRWLLMEDPLGMV